MLTKTISRVSVLALLALLIAPFTAAAQETSSVPVEIVSNGATMQGRFFKADCQGMCPTLLLVPGWPGNPDDVLGMGDRLSRSGINVLMFNPRGLHKSEGTMTFFNTLDDIGAAFEWLHDAEIVDRFGIDTSLVAIGGHSFGGGVSMAYAARDPRARAVVSVAGTDHGEFIREYQRNDSWAAMITNMLRATQAPEGPARFDLDATLRELAENQDMIRIWFSAALSKYAFLCPFTPSTIVGKYESRQKGCQRR